jgi:hypothetical protein
MQKKKSYAFPPELIAHSVLSDVTLSNSKRIKEFNHLLHEHLTELEKIKPD